MGKCPGIIAALLLPTLITTIGCSNPPMPGPATNYASLIENLEYAEASVKVIEPAQPVESLAAGYYDLFDFNSFAENPVISPEAAETLETFVLEAKTTAANMGKVTQTVLALGKDRLYVFEYENAADAAFDHQFVDWEQFVYPTGTGYDDYPIEFTLPGIPHVYCFQKGSIIVYLVSADKPYSNAEKDRYLAHIGLLTEILGGPQPPHIVALAFPQHIGEK